MFNKVILIGRLGKDPETQTTQSGKTVCKFSVATDSGYGEKKQTEWMNVVTWQKTAELCDKYLRKGSLVAIEGRLSTRNYEAKDGTKKYVTEVIANEVKFLDPKESNRTSRDEVTDEETPF